MPATRYVELSVKTGLKASSVLHDLSVIVAKESHREMMNVVDSGSSSMDDNVACTIKDPSTTQFLKTFGAGIVAAIGFACMSAWGVYIVLAPSMPILSFLPIDQGINCLIISRLFAVVALMLCMVRPSFIQTHSRILIFPCMAFAYLPVIVCSILGCSQVDIPFVALGVAWALCGVADLVLPCAWMSVLSHMPTRHIALSIALGGILATPLFLFIACASFPIVSILGGAGLIAISGVGAYMLIGQVEEDDLDTNASDQESSHLSVSAMFSVAAHSLVYGYIAIMLCSLSLPSILIAGSAGIISSCMAAWWLRKFNKHNWDTDRSQRLTIPIVVIAILIVPFTGEIGRTIGAALAIGAFSYVTLMEWTGIAVANAEFHLTSGSRQIYGLLARWVGFTAGAIVSFFAFYLCDLTPMELVYISSALVVVVVTAFAVYEGTGRKELNELLKFVVDADKSDELVIDPPKNAAPFRDRCNAIIEKSGLTPREAEVFLCLAKGRNTEYIQGKLFISASTTRTHILHIYRKLDVNSQQQLIDLVDLRDHRDN